MTRERFPQEATYADESLSAATVRMPPATRCATKRSTASIRILRGSVQKAPKPWETHAFGRALTVVGIISLSGESISKPGSRARAAVSGCSGGSIAASQDVMPLRRLRLLPVPPLPSFAFDSAALWPSEKKSPEPELPPKPLLPPRLFFTRNSSSSSVPRSLSSYSEDIL